MKSKLSTLRLSLTIALAFIIASMNLSAQGGGGNNDWQDSINTSIEYLNFVKQTGKSMNYDVNRYLQREMRFKYDLPRNQNLNLNFELITTPISIPDYQLATTATLQNTIVHYDPNTIGNYYIMVKATNADNPQQTHNLLLLINVRSDGQTKCATINGTATITIPDDVKNMLGLSKFSIKVRGLGNRGTQEISGTIPSNYAIPYSFSVVEGTYSLELRLISDKPNRQHFRQMYFYYSNSDPNYATPSSLLAKCDTTITADFNITNELMPEVVTFVGEENYYQAIYLAKGQTYTRQFTAVSSKNNPVTYSFHNEFSNDPDITASISETGLFTITSQKSGSFVYCVDAVSTVDTFAHSCSPFMLIGVINSSNIADTAKCAVIKGNIRLGDARDQYEANSLIHASAILSNLEVQSQLFHKAPFAFTQSPVIVDSATGNYSILVPKGEYKVAFSLDYNGRYRFYKNAIGINNAQVLTLNCGDTLILDSVTFYPVRQPIDTVKCAVIKGVVKDTTEFARRFGTQGMIATAILKQNVDTTDCYYEHRPITYSSNVDSNGVYSISVPKGDYVIQYSIRRVATQYYKNAQVFASAQVIPVNCGDTITLDTMYLKHYGDKEPPTSHAVITYKIKGRVYDAQDQSKGVKAQLKIFNVANNNGNEDDDEDEYGNRGYTYANSDANGNYEITLNIHVQGNLAVPTIPVKLLALPFKNKGKDAIQYEPQYYNQVATIEEASVITLDSNFIKNKDARFNFPLARKQSAIVWKHVIKGKVSNSDNTQNVMGLVTLIRKPDATQANNNFEFKNVPTDTVGGYKFDNVRPGNYIVFAIPIAAPLMPGFYKADDLAAWSWEEATEIVIPNDTVTLPEANYLIKLRNFSTNGGSGIIRGKVAANGAAQGIIQGSSPIDLGLGSVFMGIFDKNGKAVRYTYTDENGNFSFSNLAGGKFTVTASKYGYTSAAQTIEVSLDKNGAATEYNGASLILTKKDPVSSVLDNQAKEAKVYPNPANAIAKIDFEAESGRAVMTISDVQGNVILMNNISTNSGANTQDIDTRSLSNGLYIIKIQTETGKIISTMITVAK